MRTVHEFAPADRYRYDCGACSVKNGFAQVDTGQDAWYYGTWTNPFTRIIFCYCEGDTTFQQAGDDAEYVAAIRELVRWASEAGRWKGIDAMCNNALTARFNELGLGDLLH